MKNNVFSLLLIAVLSAFTFAQGSDGARITFTKETHDFGSIKNAADGNCIFEFTNTGNSPLVISSVKPSCSCMVANWSKSPVAPGEKGTVSVMYDTKRPGPISKSVTIRSNAVNEPTKMLRIRGNVAQPVEGASPVIKSETPETR